MGATFQIEAFGTNNDYVGARVPGRDGILFVICPVNRDQSQRTIQLIFRMSSVMSLSVIWSFARSALSGAHNSELVETTGVLVQQQFRGHSVKMH